MATRRLSKPVSIKGALHCPICGSSYLRRLPRMGSLPNRIRAFFGYYPWECGTCKEPFLLRKRMPSRKTG